MIFKFDEFELDADNFLLSQSGVEVKVEPLIFDLIAHLLKNANAVQSKDQLLEAVWSGKVVSDTTISSAIKSARQVLGDSGTEQKYIKTSHGRGFSFALPKQEITTLKNVGGVSLDQGFDKPSLMIIINPTGDSVDSKKLAKSFTQELERIFSRIPLLLIHRGIEQVRNAEVKLSPQQVYELIGVDYLLEGQLYENGESKVAIEFIAAKRNVMLSSQIFSYQKSLSECLIDECLLDTVGQFEPQILKAVYQDVTAGGAEVTAESKFLEASGVLALKGWHEASFIEATNLLRECLSLNPNFSQAAAYLSLLLAFGHRVGLLNNREEVKVEALDMIDKALDLDSHDSAVLGFCGCALADVGLTDRGLSLLNKALILNPANSHALVARGAARLSKFELNEAIDDMSEGIALSPHDSRLAVWRAILANAYMVANELDLAYKIAMEGCNDSHRTYMPRVVLAGIEYKRGNFSQCISAMSEAQSICPSLSEQQIKAFLGENLGHKVCDSYQEHLKT